jgi:hypothetical protein
MIHVQTVDDVYPALDELVVELNAFGEPRLAAILHHRMHQVAWTARSELFEELQSVLSKAVACDDTKLPQSLKEQIERVLRIIRNFLNAAD